MIFMNKNIKDLPRDKWIAQQKVISLMLNS